MKTVIEMTREAGFGGVLTHSGLERFAALVREDALAQREQQEPVARMVRYIGKDVYPGNGYEVARTYAELSENAYPEHWEEGAKLYSTPPSVEAAVLAERERLCSAIKAEDDYCVDNGDYMLDSDDCIAIVRGTWKRPDYAIGDKDAAIRARGEK